MTPNEFDQEVEIILDDDEEIEAIELNLKEEEGEEDELEVEMMEVDAPITWLEFFCKIILFFKIFFLALLILIYVAQERLLYVPD